MSVEADFELPGTPTDCDLHLMEIMGGPLAQSIVSEIGDEMVLRNLLKLAYFMGAQVGVDQMALAMKEMAKNRE